MAEVMTAPASSGERTNEMASTHRFFPPPSTPRARHAVAREIFTFRASSRWIDGTYSESQVESFDGCRRRLTRTRRTLTYAADHPTVLVGEDRGLDADRVPAARSRGPASPPASAPSRPLAESRCARSPRRSRASPILRGIPACPNEVRNGYDRMRITCSTSTATRRPRSFGRSSRSRPRARRSSTR